MAGFLALVGASAAALSFEDTRAVRDYRNYLNRRNNCETANIGKTINAGLDQLRAIEAIEARMPLSELPAPLYEAARLRLAPPGRHAAGAGRPCGDRQERHEPTGSRG